MNRIYLAITAIFFINSIGVQAQTVEVYNVNVNISGQVDTTQKDIKDIYYLLKHYLESNPDSVYDNPYWNSAEKKQRKETLCSMFYINLLSLEVKPKKVFSSWEPFVLSIQKDKYDKYLIRFVLQKKEMDYDQILAIIKVRAINENGSWVLENSIIDDIKIWEHSQYKFIDYYYPKGHEFNKINAAKAVAFCDSIAQILKVDTIIPFKFYLTNSVADMDILEGFEYNYMSGTTGKANSILREIYSAKGNEEYPHEFVHLIIPKKKRYRFNNRRRYRYIFGRV